MTTKTMMTNATAPQLEPFSAMASATPYLSARAAGLSKARDSGAQILDMVFTRLTSSRKLTSWLDFRKSQMKYVRSRG